jgi:hypothetical protein
MKMAKASEADLTMAMELASYLDSIERGYMPDKLSADDEASEWIETSGNNQYERLMEGLTRLLNQGSIMRVIFGMAVVCDPANKLIDPDASTIEHHPKRQQLEKQVEGLINQLSRHQRQAAIGKAIERACGELPEGFDLHVECENGAAGVRLYHPDGEEESEDLYCESGLAGEIDNAINVAIAKGGA